MTQDFGVEGVVEFDSTVVFHRGVVVDTAPTLNQESHGILGPAPWSMSLHSEMAGIGLLFFLAVVAATNFIAGRLR